MNIIKTFLKSQEEMISKYIYVSFLAVALGLMLQVAYAWVEPTLAPPGANAPTPLNESSVGQEKIGGLILNTGGAGTGLIVDKGRVGIGTTNPKAALHVVGGIGLQTGVVGGKNTGGSWNISVDGDGRLHFNANSPEENNAADPAVVIDDNTRQVDLQGNVNANDYYIRKINKYASEIGGSFSCRALTSPWTYNAASVTCDPDEFLTSCINMASNTWTMTCWPARNGSTLGNTCGAWCGGGTNYSASAICCKVK